VLDTHNVIRARLFREACVLTEGAYVKDMSLLGRPPTGTIIVDNSPASYLFQPENALPCDSYIDDPADGELWTLSDFLARAAGVADVRAALAQWTAGKWSGGYDLDFRVDEEDGEDGEDRGDGADEEAGAGAGAGDGAAAEGDARKDVDGAAARGGGAAARAAARERKAADDEPAAALGSPAAARRKGSGAGAV